MLLASICGGFLRNVTCRYLRISAGGKKDVEKSFKKDEGFLIPLQKTLPD